MGTKMGRPKSDNPKNHDMKVRVDEKTYTELTEYSEKKNITRAEVIRQSISRFLSKEK